MFQKKGKPFDIIISLGSIGPIEAVAFALEVPILRSTQHTSEESMGLPANIRYLGKGVSISDLPNPAGR